MNQQQMPVLRNGRSWSRGLAVASIMLTTMLTPPLCRPGCGAEPVVDRPLVAADVARPRLTLDEPGSDATLGEAYRQALHNLLDINTIPADMQKYNRTGLLRGDPPRLIRAG
ncbi:MAG: hypothetical protein ACYC4N_27845, partial [Pirellulaceae bacterium]